MPVPPKDAALTREQVFKDLLNGYQKEVSPQKGQMNTVLPEQPRGLPPRPRMPDMPAPQTGQPGPYLLVGLRPAPAPPDLVPQRRSHNNVRPTQHRSWQQEGHRHQVLPDYTNELSPRHRTPIVAPQMHHQGPRRPQSRALPANTGEQLLPTHAPPPQPVHPHPSAGQVQVWPVRSSAGMSVGPVHIRVPQDPYGRSFGRRTCKETSVRLLPGEPGPRANIPLERLRPPPPNPLYDPLLQPRLRSRSGRSNPEGMRPKPARIQPHNSQSPTH
ncbi:proline-rich protein 2-like [Rhinatrema bivittatum]|uniref:proline-rich protein 2-like n=1 Tax=Rhinatrema bivittatum TaxID=194408 RepID=UPI00112AABCD|nr:proline-rich protein 2-like [Rhinatrema bivittatum]